MLHVGGGSGGGQTIKSLNAATRHLPFLPSVDIPIVSFQNPVGPVQIFTITQTERNIHIKQQRADCKTFQCLLRFYTTTQRIQFNKTSFYLQRKELFEVIMNIKMWMKGIGTDLQRTLLIINEKNYLIAVKSKR